jgi:soluble lytic murein transglycosylase-like protein
VTGAHSRAPLVAVLLSLALHFPAPAAAPPAHAQSGGTGSPADVVVDVPALIVDSAQRWKVDEHHLLRIAWCESRFDPNAVGPSGVAGVFQFSARTWTWASEEAGYAGASPFDAVANVEAAAWLYATQGPRHWPGCG